MAGDRIGELSGFMEEGICFAWIGVGWFAIDGDEEGGEFVFGGCGGGQDIADLPVFQN